MPFDPTKPANNAPNSSAEMRAQLHGLKDLIDAIQTITAAQVDGVSTVEPSDPAVVTLSVADGTLHFSFALPRGTSGSDGIAGSNGSDGAPGQPGPQGEQGPPGESGQVTLQQLDDAIGGTSANSNNVATLGMTVSDPPTQSEVQDIANKLDELILVLRR